MKAYPVAHPVPRKSGPHYWAELAAGNLLRDLPLSMRRYRSRALLRQVETLTRREKFDVIVCDFLASAANIPELNRRSAISAQRRVEHLETSHGICCTFWHRAYCRGQYEKMLRYEAGMLRRQDGYRGF